MKTINPFDRLAVASPPAGKGGSQPQLPRSTRRPEGADSPGENRVLGISLVASLTLGVLAMAGRAPTMEERDNRKAVDAVLTAITLKNSRLLEESAKRTQARRTAKHITEEQHKGLEAVINKARARDWAGAEKDGYEFRKKHPFVKEGQ